MSIKEWERSIREVEAEMTALHDVKEFIREKNSLNGRLRFPLDCVIDGLLQNCHENISRAHDEIAMLEEEDPLDQEQQEAKT